MTAILASSVRDDVAKYVAAVAGVYGLIIIAYIVSSMYFSLGGRLPYSRAGTAVLGFLRDTTEPYLAIFRRILPPFGMIDLSPLLALIALGIVSGLVVNLIQG